MNKMVKNIMFSFLKKSLYGLAAASAGALLYTAQNFKPEGNDITLYIWNTVIVGGLTGLAAAITRWTTYDPSKEH